MAAAMKPRCPAIHRVPDIVRPTGIARCQHPEGHEGDHQDFDDEVAITGPSDTTVHAPLRILFAQWPNVTPIP